MDELARDIDYVLGYCEAAIRVVLEALRLEEEMAQGPLMRRLNIATLEAAIEVLDRYFARREAE